MPSSYIARYYPSVRTAIPVPGVGYPRLTAPFATQSSPCIATQASFVRLACLIHAANVRSEPGSNPSKKLAYLWNPAAYAAGSPEALFPLPLAKVGRGSVNQAKPKSLRSPYGMTQRTCLQQLTLSRARMGQALRRLPILAMALKGASRIVKDQLETPSAPAYLS
jgi:hypothetical protein